MVKLEITVLKVQMKAAKVQDLTGTSRMVAQGSGVQQDPDIVSRPTSHQNSMAHEAVVPMQHTYVTGIIVFTYYYMHMCMYMCMYMYASSPRSDQRNRKSRAQCTPHTANNTSAPGQIPGHTAKPTAHRHTHSGNAGRRQSL